MIAKLGVKCRKTAAQGVQELREEWLALLLGRSGMSELDLDSEWDVLRQLMEIPGQGKAWEKHRSIFGGGDTERGESTFKEQ